MHNVFQQQRIEQVRSRRAERMLSEHSRQLRSAARNEELRHTSLLRASDWAAQHLDAELVTTLQDGTIPLLHPTLHHFRNHTETKDNVYVRKYRPAALRASDAQSDFQQTHLLETPSVLNSPNQNQWWLRQSPKTTERFRFRSQEDRSRVIRRVKRSRLVQTEATDLYSMLNPQFRTPAKSKWTAEHDFKRFARPFGAHPVWKSPSRYLEEQYTDGFENLGLMSRKRDPRKETAGEFKAATPRDVWQRVVPPLTSLRFTKADLQLSRLSPRSDTKETVSTSARSIKLYKKSVEHHLCRVTARPKLQRSTSELRAKVLR